MAYWLASRTCKLKVMSSSPSTSVKCMGVGLNKQRSFPLSIPTTEEPQIAPKMAAHFSVCVFNCTRMGEMQNANLEYRTP